ncbi:MAG: hypothetical protein IJ399_03305 [Bacilli bacterium]|nr:hypothetical protein [Bacilli bacterium]
MFDFKNLFKNVSNETKKVYSKIEYTSEAKALIEKWMNVNGIEGISFDEYIEMLGLDYTDLINLDIHCLNLSDSMWSNPDYVGALCFKYKGIYSGYDIKFDLDDKTSPFSSDLNRLNISHNITNIIYLLKNGMGAKLIVSRSEYGDKFKHEVQKDFNLDDNKKLNEIKDTVSFISNERYYDRPRYQYTKTSENNKSFVRVDDIRENTAINVYINGQIIDFDDKVVRGKMWFSGATYLKTVLDELLENGVYDNEVSIKIEAIPGFDNLIYTRDKNGNVIIKESSKKRKVYFSFENIQEENLFTKRLTVVCDKKRINLDIISTNDIDITNLDKLISHIYDQYDGIYGIHECFNKISSISFKNPDDSLIRVVLTEEDSDRVIKSREWVRQYQFDDEMNIEQGSSMMLRK